MDEIRPTGDSPNQPSSIRRPLRRRLFLALKWFAVLVVVPILLGAIVLSIFVSSSRFHSYLIAAVQKQAGEKLGVPVVLENFALHLSKLSVDLYGITVSGANPHPNPPLLQVQHIEASIKIVSVVRRKWYLGTLRIERPVMQVYVDPQGVSNIPTFKSSGGGNTTIFDLGIRHSIIDGGVVYYNNQPSALAADLHDVDLSAAFSEPLQKYSGTLGYTDGHIAYGSVNPPMHSIHVQFDADPSTLHLAPAKLTIGRSQLSLNATLVNYSAPAIEAQYNLTADGAEIAQVLHNPSIPAGIVLASGSLQYRQAPNRALLESLQISGNLTSRRLDVKAATTRATVADLVAHYALANGDATVRDLHARVLGGEVIAHGEMKNIAGDSHSRIEASLRNVSLSELRRFAPADAAPGVALTGRLNASATASWGKTIGDLVAHADATISGQAAPSQIATYQEEPIESDHGITPPNPIPLNSEIHASYTAKDKRLAVIKTTLQTPQTNLAIDGAIGKSSRLNVQLQANDLHEVEEIADLFIPTTEGHPVKSLGLAGAATFTGTVQGTTSAPHLAGQLTAQNLQLSGTTWKVSRTNIDASQSQISLSHADLEPASRGKLTFNASAGLAKWTFSQSSPLQLQLNASNLDATDLLKLTGQQIPISGTLSANVDLHGTELNPAGNGKVTLTNATAYGEPISSMEATFSGAESAVHGDLAIHAPAGSVLSKFIIHPMQKTYSAELSSSGIHLNKLQSISATNEEITGVATLSAKGEGSFDNPQGDAVIQIPSLVVRNQNINDLKLHLNVANHLALADLTSSAVETTIQAHGRVNLIGDYQTEATLDTKAIPLAPLIAAYAPAQADDIKGETELHATLQGPLKDRQRLEAHATIPVLKLAYSDNIQLAANEPIHIDFKDGILNIERSTIRGTDADLQFQGTIPTATGSSASLVLLGTINLHLLQVLSPDLRSSGQLKLNINSTHGSGAQSYGGTIEIVDANISSPDLPVGLQHANGTLSLAKDRINISSFNGTLGGGTLAAQGGVVLGPSVRFDMGLSAKGVRMLYPQGMRESMDANLRFTGIPDRAVLGGSVNVTDISFTQAFDLDNFIGQFTGGVEAPPSRSFAQNVALNLALRSSNNVNLVSRTVSVGGSANLQVRGTLAEPVILGRTTLTGGDIILSNKRFVLTGGTVQFVNPSQTEANVNLSLTTTIQQYNITLRFEGPIDQLRTQYTSDPSLPSADIINLLAFGRTTEAAAADATPSNQAAQSVVASQVSSQITSRFSKIAGISQLSINPVLPNQNTTSGKAGANITIQQRVTGNLFITFSTSVASTESQTIQGQYQVSPRVAVSVTGDPNGGFAVDTLIKKTW
jgi:translocation and assembly module TamB